MNDGVSEAEVNRTGQVGDTARDGIQAAGQVQGGTGKIGHDRTEKRCWEAAQSRPTIEEDCLALRIVGAG